MDLVKYFCERGGKNLVKMPLVTDEMFGTVSLQCDCMHFEPHPLEPQDKLQTLDTSHSLIHLVGFGACDH
jgi:hypothetical protein